MSGNQQTHASQNAEPAGWTNRLAEAVISMGRDILSLNIPEPDTRPEDLDGSVLYLLGRLPERTRRILVMRYRDSMTLAEIGEKEHISKERVRQLINIGLCAMARNDGGLIASLGLEHVIREKISETLKNTEHGKENTK